MHRATWTCLAGVVSVVFTAGCGGPELRRFNHSFHRVNYNITDAELRELQFYTSVDILVKVMGAPPAGAAPVRADRIYVTRGTPGQVVDSFTFCLEMRREGGKVAARATFRWHFWRFGP